MSLGPREGAFAMNRPTGTQGLFSKDRLHVPFVATGLAIAILGGFVLAIALPVSAAVGHPGLGWVTHAQVHGHLQTVGFVGLFIVGVSYRLLPGFAHGRALAFPRLAPASLWLIGGGVLLRAAGQPAADQALPGVLLVAGAWAELAGALCFAAIVFAMAWPAARARELYAPFFLAGAAWFLVQAALGALWLTALARDGQTVLSGTRDGALVELQFFGFHLMFILGVGIRTFPVFFAARRPGWRAVAPVFALIQVALVALTAARVVDATGGDTPWLIEDLGGLALGLGLLGMVVFTGAWRSPTRIRPASRPFALTLQPAMAWLAVAAALEGWFALHAALAHDLPAGNQVDAVHHVIGVGVVLMTIVAMAQMVLPEFASERLAGRQGAWRGLAFGVLLSIATILRAGSRLLAGRASPDLINWSMAAAGTIALGVLLVFAYLFARSLRNQRAILAKVAAFTAGERAIPMTDR
jgi:hypothetical protein